MTLHARVEGVYTAVTLPFSQSGREWSDSERKVDSSLQNFSCRLQAILSKCSVQHLWTPQRWVLEGPSLSSPLEEMHRVRKCVFVCTGIYGD